MVSSADLIGNLMKESLLQDSLTEQLQSIVNKNKENTKNAFERLQENAQNIPSVLNKNTLQDLIDGKYDITLKDYTNLTTYNLMMSNLYGNNSANPFTNSLNNLLGTKENTLATAKTFVETMKERGLSNASALKMYSALQNYSTMSNLNILNNSSFVSAKI